jgi:hypothetical protein
MYSVFGALWLLCLAVAASAAAIVETISARLVMAPIKKRIAASSDELPILS